MIERKFNWVWIFSIHRWYSSWFDGDMIIPGEFQIGLDIKPLDPNTVSSVVKFGTSRFEIVHEARGRSLIYNQLYPFEGLENYTSGIIHHVRLTGELFFFLFPTKSSIGQTGLYDCFNFTVKVLHQITVMRYVYTQCNVIK